MPPSSPAKKTGGGAGLVADYPTMQLVVLGYMVPVAVAEQLWPDLT